MRILFVSANFPADFQSSVHGIYKRMGMMIEAIRGIAHIELLFYVSPSVDISPPSIVAIKQKFTGLWGLDNFELTLCHKPNERVARGWLDRYILPATSIFHQSVCNATSGTEQAAALEKCLSRKPDAIFAHRLDSMCVLLRTRPLLPPVFFDMDDIEHVAFARAIEQPPRWRTKRLQYLQLPALVKGERRAVALSRTTFVCSELDRVHLAGKFKRDNIAVIPNAVAIPPPPSLQAAPALLFVGFFGYVPNVNAAEFLISQVWPLIRTKTPEARLTIAGAQPEKIASFHAGPEGVNFTGFVEDLDAVYRDTRIVCCPILSGGGTRVKILEAAAYGKPIVSTTLGAEGIEFADGAEILLRNDAQSFADACISLLQNENECRRLGDAARTAVKSRYERNNIITTLRAHIQAALPAKL